MVVYYKADGSRDDEKSVPAPPINIVKSWDAYDFITQRLTAAERKAIRAAAKVNADVEDFQHLLDVAAASKKRIEADNAELISGLALMESEGLIEPGRAAAILA